MKQSALTTLEKIPLALAIVFSCVFFTPCVGLNLDFHSALWVHIVSFLCLGVIFEIPAVCLNASSLFLFVSQSDWCLRAKRIRKNFWWQYCLTHFAGPFFGILTVVSGIYLIKAGGHSFDEGWLFWIMVAAVFGLYEGIFHRNVFVKRIFNFLGERPLDEQRLGELRGMVCSPFDQTLIWSEPLTFGFIFMTAYLKPGDFVNPLGFFTGPLEHLLGSSVLSGLFFLTGGIFLIPLFQKKQVKSC